MQIKPCLITDLAKRTFHKISKYKLIRINAELIFNYVSITSELKFIIKYTFCQNFFNLHFFVTEFYSITPYIIVPRQ